MLPNRIYFARPELILNSNHPKLLSNPNKGNNNAKIVWAGNVMIYGFNKSIFGGIGVQKVDNPQLQSSVFWSMLSILR